ncbi:hypothetical protein TIFTF001_039283 [Ficus carica]|uniref:Uncharacterized protein n=1 Tax=Ficus carica TaxID=3494 RepID=A0AA88E8U6_FICCA|nr:hypothetical protein TIFTF001_039283 [Ficus carica]
MMASKLPHVVPTYHKGGFGPWFELEMDWSPQPLHGCATRVVLAERKLTTYVYAVVYMDPRRVDEDRDVAYTFHGMQPLIFNGTRQTVSLSGWLHDMESIFRICYIEAYLKVPLASRCLAVIGRLWWMILGEPAIQGGSWADFRTLIIAHYGPLPDEEGQYVAS